MRRLSLPGFGATLLVAGAAFLLYLPALSYPFLNWDDPGYVIRNPWIRGWSFQNLAFVFTQPYFANFLPLHLLSYMVDYSLWGLNPFGYHLHSILLHALNSALAFLVVRRLSGRDSIGFLAALLFAVHPSHVESVAWVSARKDLLSTAFGLLAAYFFADSAPGGTRRRSYVASLVCFTFGMLAKVSLVTLPLFLLLLDRLKRPEPRRGGWGSDVARQVPFLLVGCGLSLLNAHAQAKAGAPYAQHALSYAMVKGHAAWTYLGLLFGVLRGSPDYDLPVIDSNPLTVLVLVAGLALLPGAAWLAYRARRRNLCLGAAWIFIGLIPALAFPLVTYMADRYLYAPSLGLCWIVAAGIVALGDRLPAAGVRRAAVGVLSLLVLAGFTARTTEALPVWRDSESLWTYALTRCSDTRAYANLAEVRIEQKRWDEAESLLVAGASAEDPTAQQNYAVLHFERGQYTEALADLDRALDSLRRRGWERTHASVLYFSRSAVYWRLGRKESALADLETAVREDPRNEMARRQLDQIRGSE